MGEIVFSATLILLCSACLLNLFWAGMSAPEYDPLGTALWPGILGGAIVALLWLHIVLKEKNKDKDTNEKVENSFSLGELFSNKLFLSFMFFLIYILLLDRVGFLFSTPLFIVAYMTLLGENKWKTKIITTITATVALYLIFSWFLQVPLPRGYGIFRDISLFFEIV